MNSKYSTREDRLRNKIKEELSHPKPNVDRFVEISNEFETANLETIKKLTRRKKTDDKKIKGALKQAINAHGPITMELIGSATKRINGALMVSETFNPKPEGEGNPFSIRGILLGAAIATIILLGVYIFI